MKKFGLLLPALLLIAIISSSSMACGGDAGETAVAPPSQTVENFVEAVNQGDYGRIYELHSSLIRQEFTADELAGIIKSVYPEGTRLEDFQSVNENISGNRATVDYRIKIVAPGGGGEGQVEEKSVGLLMEDGQWKLN